MNIKNQQSIRVYNYTQSKVCLETRTGRQYVFERSNEGVPSMDYMSWEDIEWLNGRSEIFRNGTLRFDPSSEQEIFEALGCPDYRDAMFTEERIHELLLNPTSENVETIIGLTSDSVLERIRGTMHQLISVGENVSAKMESVVNARASELRDGKLKSAMVVKKREKPENTNDKVIEELQAQMKAMQEQLNAKSEQSAAPAPKKAPAPKRKPSSGSKKPTSSKKK